LTIQVRTEVTPKGPYPSNVGYGATKINKFVTMVLDSFIYFSIYHDPDVCILAVPL